jgi:Mannosyl-glycoprotein endo-beta-N-acetylglucosaminidase
MDEDSSLRSLRSDRSSFGQVAGFLPVLRVTSAYSVLGRNDMMKHSLAAALLVLGSPFLLGVNGATAGSPPVILMSAKNKVPACVTPEGLMAFAQTKNKKLLPKFKTVAKFYKQHGQELNVRWDYAFYQMLVETNWLRYHRPDGKRGDVDASQNNFAGIGATGGGAPGEVFPDVSTGVLAHLGHIRLYSGKPVDEPAAQRTRDVTSIILPWAKKFGRPVTYADLTIRWAPPAKGYYAKAIETVAELYREQHCTGKTAAPAESDAAAGATPEADPATDTAEASPMEPADAATPAEVAAADEPAKPEKTTITARAKPFKASVMSDVALEPEAQAEVPAIDKNKLMSAGLSGAAPSPEQEPAAATVAPEGELLSADGINDGGINADTGQSDSADVTPPAAVEQEQVASLAPDKTPGVISDESAVAAKAKTCGVFTASFGGAKSLLIEAIDGEVRRLTALTVQEGKEDAQAAAFISTHATGGRSLGTFGTADEALVKAFELCPEK